MLLRASGEYQGKEYDLRAISKQGFASGVENGELLIEFANAVMSPDETRLAAARQGIVETMGGGALVETAAVAGNFNQLVRIADATGIPIDSMALGLTAPTRETLDINHFKSARNTLGA
jgi:hypothetical protein